MIKAAFFDIDGTLLSHKTNTVPASAAGALARLREQGILTFIATGRPICVLAELRPLEGLTFDGVISLNGSYCRNDKEVIFDSPIPREDIVTLLEYLKENPYPCIFVEAESMYINFHNDRVRRVQEAIHSSMPAIGDLNRGYDHNIYQIMLYMTDEELARLPPLKHIRITRWTYGGVDVIPASGGKSLGIEKILEYYGISKKETIAFGDGENDVDMLRAVGTAVAMGNACGAAKEAAHYVTDSVDDDGIWNALVYLGVL